MLALLLTIGVVATTPLTFAKYATSATASASINVARWDVTKGAGPNADLVVFRNEALHLPAGGANTKTVSVTINSEVATDIIIRPKYGAGNNDFSTTHKESQTSNFDPVWDIVDWNDLGAKLDSSVHGTQFSFRYEPTYPTPKTITFTIHLYGLGRPPADAGGFHAQRIVPGSQNYDRTYEIEFVAVQVD